jgi:hypothetical protein
MSTASDSVSDRITVTSPTEDKKLVEQLADKDIERFNRWFQALGNDPLLKSEVAIIKTFLYFKLFEEKKSG